MVIVGVIKQHGTNDYKNRNDKQQLLLVLYIHIYQLSIAI
jgi:hypothetical protein